MGLFSNDKNEKTDVNKKYEAQISEFLLSGEVIEEIHALILDFLCVTNKRLIFVDKDFSFKSPKTTIYSMPYSQICGLGLEKNEKAFAFTDTLILVTKGKTHELKFMKGTNIKEVYNKIAEKLI